MNLPEYSVGNHALILMVSFWPGCVYVNVTLQKLNVVTLTGKLLELDDNTLTE